MSRRRLNKLVNANRDGISRRTVLKLATSQAFVLSLSDASAKTTAKSSEKLSPADAQTLSVFFCYMQSEIAKMDRLALFGPSGMPTAEMQAAASRMFIGSTNADRARILMAACKGWAASAGAPTAA